VGPTEKDFCEVVVTETTVSVPFKENGTCLIFARTGRILSFEPPSIAGPLGRAPRWEIEWLARMVAETALGNDNIVELESSLAPPSELP
jgi:hypothetical protein